MQTCNASNPVSSVEKNTTCGPSPGGSILDWKPPAEFAVALKHISNSYVRIFSSSIASQRETQSPANKYQTSQKDIIILNVRQFKVYHELHCIFSIFPVLKHASNFKNKVNKQGKTSDFGVTVAMSCIK